MAIDKCTHINRQKQIKKRNETVSFENEFKKKPREK